MSGFRFKNVSVEDVQTSHNNWRGALGAIQGLEPAGGKFLRLHGANFTRYTAVGNQARGLWFDTDNEDVIIDQAFLAQNQSDGLLLESNKGPFTIKNSQICSNAGLGIYTSHTESVTVTGNLIYGNQKSQIFVNGQSKQRAGNNWETGANYIAIAQRWSLRRILSWAPMAANSSFGTYQLSPESSSLFSQTLASNNNTWYNPSNEKVFEIDPGGVGHKPRDMNICNGARPPARIKTRHLSLLLATWPLCARHREASARRIETKSSYSKFLDQPLQLINREGS